MVAPGISASWDRRRDRRKVAVGLRGAAVAAGAAGAAGVAAGATEVCVCAAAAPAAPKARAKIDDEAM